MDLRVSIRVLGLLLMLFSFSMLPPLGVALYLEEVAVQAFGIAAGSIFAAGALLFLPNRAARREMRLRDGFLVVAMFWVVLGLAGAVPLALTPDPQMSITDAVFESMSGLTTTGATVLVGLDQMPASILYYRQQLQWLGGMGIIVLAVAVLPMLGVGGMQLYRAETPGPMKDAKLTARISETAKALWYIYVAFTVLCAAAYMAAGMNLFDAIGHAFSTIAIGGFSTHDASIGYFDSLLIEVIAVVFMFLAGVNFSLHFLAWRRQSLVAYFADQEFRFYVSILLLLTLITTVYLYSSAAHVAPESALKEYAEPGRAFIAALFQVVSIGTTTGFTTAEYAHWPGFLPALLIFASFIGGCAGSTGGGMKVIRVLLLMRQGLREVRRLIHPSATIPVKLGRAAVEPRVVEAVWGFFSVYIFTFSGLMLFLMATGLDQVTAFSAVAATLNNLGPGLGEVASNFTVVGDAGKWVCVFAMLLGRLEIFTLLVLLTPGFWQR